MSWKKSKFFVCIFVCLSITLVQFIILWKKHRRYISRPEGSKARLLVVLYFSQKYNLNGCFRYHCDDNGDVRSWARGMFNQLPIGWSDVDGFQSTVVKLSKVLLFLWPMFWSVLLPECCHSKLVTGGTRKMNCKFIFGQWQGVAFHIKWPWN